MDHFNFQPSPMACSSNIEIDIEDGIIPAPGAEAAEIAEVFAD